MTAKKNSQDSSVLAVSRKEKVILSASHDIVESDPGWDDRYYNHAILSQVGLPRSKTSESNFMRKNGSAWINIQSGFIDTGNGPVMQPIPYGSMPRLILAWLATFAIKHKTQEINVGKSRGEFLKLMGQDGQGNRYSTLDVQMPALAAARLQFGYSGRTYNGQPVQQFDAWSSNPDNGMDSKWPGVLILSDEYYTSLKNGAVPLDRRALFALKGSSLRIDIYAWLANRLCRIEGRQYLLPWKPLREQFGQEYKGKNPDKDFSREFIAALNDVKCIYPKAKVKVVKGGVMLMSSPPPVPFKD